MARAYAARLGCIAFVFGLLQHFFGSGDAGQTVIHAIVFVILYSGLGFVIGGIAEECIRQSVESNFRRSLENSKKRAKSQGTNQR